MNENKKCRKAVGENLRVGSIIKIQMRKSMKCENLCVAKKPQTKRR